MSVIDLDRNATTPLHPAAAEAMRRVEAEAWGNPASAHSLGRKSRQYLEDSREKIAHLLTARPEEVIFTSGATEANNLALFGQVGLPPGSILSSKLEHPCVIEPLRELARRRFEVKWIAPTPAGRVEPMEVIRARTPGTRMIVMMLANHETGIVQNVRAMGGSVAFHCDAAQAVGKMPVRFEDLGITSMSLSAHKFRGPKGVGALIVRKDAAIKPYLFGGPQQRGLRPGTGTPSLAVGMAVALEHAVADLDEHRAKLQAIRRQFLERLQHEVPPVVVNGSGEGLPGTLNVSFPGVRADVLLMALDLAGVACSTGSACSSGSLLPSPVLEAMGVSQEILASAMRFSFDTSFTEVDEAVERIAMCVRNARRAM